METSQRTVQTPQIAQSISIPRVCCNIGSYPSANNLFDRNPDLCILAYMTRLYDKPSNWRSHRGPVAMRSTTTAVADVSIAAHAKRQCMKKTIGSGLL